MVAAKYEENQDPGQLPAGERYFLGRIRTGKLVGLLLGGLVVGVMLFMMFVILGGLMSGEQ